MKNAADLLIWAIVLHLVADWLLQNEWMSVNKASRWTRRIRTYSRHGVGSGQTTFDGYGTTSHWWLRHPAAYVHAGIHGAIQLLIFPWWAALFIGVTHLLIDTRKPVEWWSKLIRQTQPSEPPMRIPGYTFVNFYSIGTEVRIWADQVCHIAVVAIAALAVAA